MLSGCADAGIAHQRPDPHSLPGAILVRTVVPPPPPIAGAGGERVSIEELPSSRRATNRATPTSTPRGSHGNAAEADGEGEKTESGQRSHASAGSGRSATAPPAGTRFSFSLQRTVSTYTDSNSESALRI